MTREEIAVANTTLRKAIQELSDLIDLDLEPQVTMSAEDLEDENEQLEGILTRARDVADDVLEEGEE